MRVGASYPRIHKNSARRTAYWAKKSQTKIDKKRAKEDKLRHIQKKRSAEGRDYALITDQYGNIVGIRNKEDR